MPIDFTALDDGELAQSYGQLISELKKRNIIRGNNIVGDLGEYLAINYYNNIPVLDNLQLAPPGTQNVDALSRKGERYSIKSTVGKVTGVFYHLPSPDSDEVPDRKFEYVIIVLFDGNYNLKRICELTWEQFLKHKRWHKTMRAYNLPINKTLLGESNTIFIQNNDG